VRISILKIILIGAILMSISVLEKIISGKSKRKWNDVLQMDTPLTLTHE
jgi:hypothetical protein